MTAAGGKGRGVIAVDAASGTIAWQSLDVQNGYSSPVLASQSWTVPTLSGTRLYLRDRRQIVALDLGRP